jgi:hypothetical protein
LKKLKGARKEWLREDFRNYFSWVYFHHDSSGQEFLMVGDNRKADSFMEFTDDSDYVDIAVESMTWAMGVKTPKLG